MIFELLRQKPCRIIYKFRQKVSFGPEAYEIGPKVGNRFLSYKSVSILQVGFCAISRFLSYKVGFGPLSRLLSYKSVSVL